MTPLLPVLTRMVAVVALRAVLQQMARLVLRHSARAVRATAERAAVQLRALRVLRELAEAVRVLLTVAARVALVLPGRNIPLLSAALLAGLAVAAVVLKPQRARLAVLVARAAVVVVVT